jgi:hypothetical protein
MQQRSVLLILALAAATAPLQATAIVADRWYQFISQADNSVLNGSANEPTYFDPGTVPWTFNLITAGFLQVTEAMIAGETYNIFNNGVQIGFTGTTPQLPPQSAGLLRRSAFLQHADRPHRRHVLHHAPRRR